METRRGKGEGSVSYLAARKRWCGRIRIDGKTKAFYGMTKQQVLDDIAAYRKAFKAGQVTTAGEPTVGDQLEAWHSTLEMTGRKATTITNYRMVINTLIPAKLKDIPLRSLKPEHVTSMVLGLRQTEKSANTQRLARTVLRRALEVAVREGKVDRNVAAQTDGVALKREKRVPLTTEQAKQVLAYVAEHESPQWQAAYALALRTGIRLGEMLALQWRSVDLEAGTITIDGTLCRYGQTRTEPKTASGRRTIAISHAVVTALAAHQASQHKASPEGYVFTSRFGTPLAAKTPADHLRRVLVALGLPHVVWHDLRHTVATMMLASGVPLQLVSKILGHASVQITADLYNYIPPEATREAAEALERVLS